jgi:hypothetical protein
MYYGGVLKYPCNKHSLFVLLVLASVVHMHAMHGPL